MRFFTLIFYLICLPFQEGCTPLILAISEHQEEVVDFLLRNGADVHAQDENKR